MKWLITHRRYHDRIASGSGPLPSRLEVKSLPTLLRVLATRSFQDYDVWYAQGDRTFQKVAAGSVPGRAPGDWFNFKYTPAPPELLLIQQNVPTGNFADMDFLHPLVFTPSRSVRLNHNEIEAALYQSDLSRDAVAKAMGYLPDLTLFYNYLEQKGQIKTIHLVRSLLSH